MLWRKISSKKSNKVLKTSWKVWIFMGMIYLPRSSKISAYWSSRAKIFSFLAYLKTLSALNNVLLDSSTQSDKSLSLNNSISNTSWKKKLEMRSYKKTKSERKEPLKNLFPSSLKSNRQPLENAMSKI